MAATCQTRPIREKHVVRTKIESDPFRKDRFHLKTLRRELIKSAAELRRSAYPEIYGSPLEMIIEM